jgi:hypothetical protein
LSAPFVAADGIVFAVSLSECLLNKAPDGFGSRQWLGLLSDPLIELFDIGRRQPNEDRRRVYARPPTFVFGFRY